ncbi:g10651 [Coccomyxa elongata]
MMNRAGSRLKPIAPRPTADSISPTSTVSAVSLDPKDYVYPHADYVWGVPQAVHPSVVQQQHAYMSPCVASNPGMYGTYGSVMSPWGQSAMPQYHSPMAPASAGHMPPPQPAQPMMQDLQQPRTQQSTGDGGKIKDATLPAEGDATQVVPKLEGVDELLNIPLDEECLQRLLSGDELDEDAAAAMDLGTSHSFKEQGDVSGDSTCTGEAKAKKAPQSSSAEEGDSASGADDLLTTTDLSRCMADSSMLKSVASFGDLDLDYLTSIHELEASDNHMLSFVGECNGGSLDSSCAAKRGDGLNRTRSEAALPSSSAKKGNPLSALGPDAGLQCIADFLASDTVRCLPKEQRAAAAEAVKALRAAFADAQQPGGQCEALGRSNSVPKRKRTNPPRTSSCKSFKGDAAAVAAAAPAV